MIRMVNGTPPTPEAPEDRARRKARAELYKQHRYGCGLEDAWALMMADMKEGTYDAHCREWVRMLKAANLFPSHRERLF